MSNSSIEGKLKGLHERIQNEMLRTRRDAPFSNQGGLDSPRPGSVRRPRPLFRDIPAFPPRSPHAAETENRMREVHKVSGNLTVNGVKYRSNVDDLQHLGELGSGTCGHVVKMLHKSSGAVIAVKQMRRSGNSEETKRILMDLDVVLGSHDCPYIVRCLGCFVTDADVWICMELMASCFDKLLKKLGEPIPEAILGKVTVATVNALSYLKDTHGVIHRDVKPSNILLDERGNVKLCDFGISGRLVDSKAKTRSAGCAAYMAPERIDPPDPTRPDYDIRADVWSLGISLVELATGAFPYRNCQNDFEVLTKVISDDPPQLPDDSNFSPEFKSFVSKCLTKNYRERPKYAKLLEHPFVVQSARSKVSVGDWYASLPLSAHGTPSRGSVTTTSTYAVSRDVDATPPPPQPPRSYVSSEHWTPEQVTPTPSRPYWATAGSSYSGSSNSQPASLEADYSNYSPYPRRRTLEMSSSPPQPPARRLSADHRWKPTSNSGNTSPIVLQRFFHQSQQRRSRADLHSPRHRSLSREHSNGRSPEPPPRTSRHHGLGAQDNRSNGSTDSELASLLDRLNGPTAAALLRNDRLVETRSHSLTRMEHCNGCHQSPNSPRHLTRGEQGRREPHVHLQHHSWVHTDSWSLPSSPLPPRAPSSRPVE